MSHADYDALGAYCEAYEDFVSALAEIEDEGTTVTTMQGGMKAHPAVARKNAAIERLLKVGGKFGMNPSDRQNLSVGTVEDDDPLLEILKRRGSDN